VAHLCEESNSKRSTATNATAVLVAVPCSPPFAFNCFVEPAKNRLPLEPTKNCHFDRSCSRSCEQRSGEIRCTTQHSVPANTAFFAFVFACSFVVIQQGTVVVLSVASEASGKIELFQLPGKAFHTAPNAAHSLKACDQKINSLNLAHNSHVKP
jgi:hypothetical protein